MAGRFTGKAVLVAGGTGALGRAVSLAFLDELARVAVTYQQQEEFVSLKNAAAAHASSLEGHKVNIIDETAVRQLTDSIITKSVWAAAVVTSVLFFAALLLHELAHSLLAKARGLRVRAITLFALGGVSQIESEASDAKSEFWIAIAGPITSVVIGLVVLGTARLAGWAPGAEPAIPVIAVLVWLGYINIMLAAFNMIPGYPLDGGRVLRAVIWWIIGDADRSTRLSAQVGQAVAFMLILLGLFRFFVGANFGGLWLAFIGWFLLDAARASYVQVELIAGLRGRRVADLMDRDCSTVEGHVSLQDFVDEYLLRSGRRCFVVVQK